MIGTRKKLQHGPKTEASLTYVESNATDVVHGSSEAMPQVESTTLTPNKDSLSLARAKPRNREEAAKVQTVWGAPEPAPNPSLVAIPSKPNDEVADTQMDDEVTQKLQHTPPRTESEAAKRAKTTPKEPWTGYFTTVPNEGRGDCAYLAIAQAMTQAAGKSSSTKKGDFKAGGRLQAQLRLLASKELEKKPKLYMIDGDLSSIATDAKRAGFSLNHTASTLLQTPAIWTFAFGLGIIHSNDGIFTSFAVMPHRPKNRLQLYIFVCKLNITNGFAHQKKSLKTFAMVGLKQPRLSLGTRNSMEEETNEDTDSEALSLLGVQRSSSSRPASNHDTSSLLGIPTQGVETALKKEWQENPTFT